MSKQKVLNYVAHWDGEICSDCGTECEWNAEDETLECVCSDRPAIDVYLGNTP